MEYDQISFKVRKSLVKLVGLSPDDSSIEGLFVTFNEAAAFPDVLAEERDMQNYMQLAKELISEAKKGRSPGGKSTGPAVARESVKKTVWAMAQTVTATNVLRNSEFFKVLGSACEKCKLKIRIPLSLVRGTTRLSNDEMGFVRGTEVEPDALAGFLSELHSLNQGAAYASVLKEEGLCEVPSQFYTASEVPDAYKKAQNPHCSMVQKFVTCKSRTAFKYRMVFLNAKISVYKIYGKSRYRPAGDPAGLALYEKGLRVCSFYRVVFHGLLQSSARKHGRNEAMMSDFFE